jgi:hypothetical protein
VTVDVGLDTTVGVAATTSGYLVPLMVEASIPCPEGSAHALLEASAGQFIATAAPAMADMSAAGSRSVIQDAASDAADAATEAAAPASSRTPATASTAALGATTTILLTPTGAKNMYRGFTTLLLSGVPLSARIQVSVGDALACKTISPAEAAADAGVEIADSGTCSP